MRNGLLRPGPDDTYADGDDATWMDVNWLALQRPEAVTAIVTQNGNAYEEGLGKEAWAPVLALIAEALELPRASVSLVSGGSSRDKIVELAGIDPDETDRRLAGAGGEETSA